jgi:hypothetical protein
MQTSIQIIEEIKREAAELQRKFLSLPGQGEEASVKQQKLIDDAQKGLLGWRSWELGELEKAFSE